MKTKSMNNRRKQIVEMLNQTQSLKVTELAKQFGVSEVTIRNDALALEKNGFCRRGFGKLLPCGNESAVDKPLKDKGRNWPQKECIGKYAASLIRPGDSVMFYAGSTVEQVVRYIDPEVEFIALTNSVYIAEALCGLQKAHTLLLGGLFNQSLGFTYGDTAIRQLQEYNIDKLFLSVDGIDAASGITNASPFERDINREVISCAKQVIIVADYSKVGYSSFVKMGSASDVDILITDANADPQAMASLAEAGVDVRVAPEVIDVNA